MEVRDELRATSVLYPRGGVFEDVKGKKILPLMEFESDIFLLSQSLLQMWK